MESCVNRVGVNINTASKHILTYIFGTRPGAGGKHRGLPRRERGFQSRRELLKVPRLGAGLSNRRPDSRVVGGTNPLDNSAVHLNPHIAGRMAADAGVTRGAACSRTRPCANPWPERYVDGDVGLPTVTDILEALDNRGLDPREQLQVFAFDPNVHTIDDLRPGMQLPGIVTNITAFGAFVDIGVKQDETGPHLAAGRPLHRLPGRRGAPGTARRSAGDRHRHRPRTHFTDHAQGRLGDTPRRLTAVRSALYKAPSSVRSIFDYSGRLLNAVHMHLHLHFLWGHTEFGAVGGVFINTSFSRGSVRRFHMVVVEHEHQFGRKRPHPVVHHHRIVDVELPPVIDPVERVVEIDRGLRR